MTAVTPTDRPKSVRNCCVIKVFGGVFFYVVTLLFYFSVSVRALVIGLISSFFSCFSFVRILVTSEFCKSHILEFIVI